MMSGFICKGAFTRNQVFNTPIQGPAFHILLWCLIRIVKIFKERKMKSKVIGEIHDAVLIDAHKKEYNAVLEIMQQVMTVDVRKAWDWIIIPLQIEIEASDVNWFEKQRVELN